VLCIHGSTEMDWEVQGKIWYQLCPVQISRSWGRCREGPQCNQQRAPWSLPGLVPMRTSPGSAGSFPCWVGRSPSCCTQRGRGDLGKTCPAPLTNTITNISFIEQLFTKTGPLTCQILSCLISASSGRGSAVRPPLVLDLI